MRWFNNRRMMSKLLLAFLPMCAMIAGIGWIGIRNLGLVNANVQDIYEEKLQQAIQLAEMRGLTHQLRASVYRALAAGDPAEEKTVITEARAMQQKLTEKRDALGPTITAPEVASLFDSYVAAAAEYDAYREQKVFQTLLAGDRAGAVEAARVGVGKFKPTIEGINQVIAKANELSREKYESSMALFQSSQKMMIGIAVGASLLGLGIAFQIGRIVSRPLKQSVEVLAAVAAGDFTQTLNVNTKDEVGQMAKALNQAVDGIRSALTEVRVVSAGLASASQQLSAASQEISSGAQEQASNLEETASSLEEITSTVKQNADNAQQANQLASRSREVAEKGGQVVHNAVAGMGEINKASKQIADIITAIDEIAFQTNLLALNAAVEAARAGEQGRGFAVVAAEVRNLAQRSAGAAKEIKGLIQDSVRKVEAGSDLVNQSGETLQEIVTSVKRVTDIVGEIAAASREQSTGIDQVSKAVAQMDQVTQTNASQTEELSGTAESLSGQANQLQELVARFKLDAEETPRTTPAMGFKPAARGTAMPRTASHSAKRPATEPAAVESRIEQDLDLIAAGVGEGAGDGFAEF